jgi:hypothetical protein
MTTPIVTEISRPLEAVSRDTFISALPSLSPMTSSAPTATRP